ncbi:MAG: hypothetical protein JSS44_13455 [Proteobacteria bacterium]|nr:hypothetical protein [Pseudomonadota bacterium]
MSAPCALFAHSRPARRPGRRWLLAPATGLLALLTLPAWAGIGEDFGARDPAICPLRDAPSKGGPSSAQALRYLACDSEHVGDHGSLLYLLSEVQLSAAPKARAFDARTDGWADQIDATQPVYALRGNFRIYQCARTSSPDWLANPGHACRYQNFYDHSGLCWKALDGGWHCAMTYQINPAHTVHSVAPPPAGRYLAIGASLPPDAVTPRKKARTKRHR